MIADYISLDSKIVGMSAYIDPQRFKNDDYELNEKSDIYSLGVILWEVSSGYPPFISLPIYTFEHQVLNGMRENPIENTPSQYVKLYQKCWQLDERPNIGQVHEILTNDVNMSLTAEITAEITTETKQNLINQLKLNHGLIITEDNDIRPSKQAVIDEDGELNKNLYKRQPFVYTYINNSKNICINFPVVEITYNGGLSESFSMHANDENLLDVYGDFLARKFLVGGRLFI